MTDEIREYQHFIGGKWVESNAGETFESINPTSQKAWYTLPEASAKDVESAVAAARRALETAAWRDISQTARGALLRGLGDLVLDNADALAEIETQDIGKLIRETRAQAHAVPNWFYYFAGAADKMRGAVIPGIDPTILNYTLREPVGVVVAIVPWNSPLMLAATKIAPALAAGNTVVVKPSEHASASIFELGKLIEEAGFPPGVVNIVSGHAEPSRQLVEHPEVDMVTFTGSTAVGRTVAQAALSHFAAVALELGGKSPQIVFEDADLEAAAIGVVGGIFAAAGQSCVAGSRVLVHERLYEGLMERVLARVRSIRVGDPMSEETELGPLAFAGQLERVSGYVDQAISEGADVAAGGGQLERRDPGLFYLPTVLTGVRPEMTVAREEVFGPVLAVMEPFRTDEEAIARANETPFGLAAGVWTESLRRAHRVSSQLKAGTVWINMYRAISPLSPFGGFGPSGMGKENSIEGLLQFTKLKSIWVNTDSGAPTDPFRLRL
ncbi:MAG TPA: aldehyde dehydrogenase [Gammaproteobacteria bacterium]|nr:aldehyde dehydrogenase [Gammaproteobacteria bacterium]